MTMMMRFKTKQEMLDTLSEYKRYINEYDYISSQLDVHSVPTDRDNSSTGHGDKVHAYNDIIARRDEIDAKLRDIELMVSSLKSVDDMSYRIIWYKFIDGMTLEDISVMLCYSLSHIQHNLYPKAKRQLFELYKDDQQLQ